MEKELPLPGGNAGTGTDRSATLLAHALPGLPNGQPKPSAYARAHGLAVKSFYYWKRRLRQLKAIESTSQRQSPQPMFHAVRVRRAQGVEPACRLHFPHGMTCELMAIDDPGLERLLVTVSRLSR